jgi:hypothetical protein
VQVRTKRPPAVGLTIVLLQGMQVRAPAQPLLETCMQRHARAVLAVRGAGRLALVQLAGHRYAGSRIWHGGL